MTFARTPGDTVFEDFQNHQACPGIPGIGVQLERNTHQDACVKKCDRGFDVIIWTLDMRSVTQKAYYSRLFSLFRPQLRNPGYLGHSFRENPDIDSGKPRTVIPGEAGQF